jgi:hypothetical protein
MFGGAPSSPKGSSTEISKSPQRGPSSTSLNEGGRGDSESLWSPTLVKHFDFFDSTAPLLDTTPDNREEELSASQVAAMSSPMENKQSMWSKYLNEDNGAHYYYNETTGEATYDTPPSYRSVNGEAGA